jgi:carbamate kinase
MTSEPTPNRTQPLAVVAIGGNSLILDKAHQAVQYQWDAVVETANHITNMIQEGWTVVITHGNGPQVGFILRRNELAAHELHTTPMDLIVADTQGSIGYMLQQMLSNEFRRRGLARRACTIVTQVRVDLDDPAFRKPDKPIGSFMDEATALRHQAEGWDVMEDAGRGWRRVVPSPEPLEILELDAIRETVARGWIVIAGGGGGIPVVRDEYGDLHGIAAVIDKDRLSSLLASELRADLFVISTGVEKVALDFGTKDQRTVDRLDRVEARRYLAEGQFPAGSMGPKIEAVLGFLERGGQEALITDPPHLGAALKRMTGTRIVR